MEASKLYEIDNGVYYYERKRVTRFCRKAGSYIHLTMEANKLNEIDKGILYC